MAKLQGRGNKNRSAFSKQQIELAIKLRKGLGGLSPSGNKCWSYPEIAKHESMKLDGKVAPVSTISSMIKRNDKISDGRVALQKRDVKSIRLMEGELMTDAIGGLLGELLGRDFGEVKTDRLPEMISTLVNTRKNNEAKSLEEIDAAEILDRLAKDHAAKGAAVREAAATTIIEMEEDEHGNYAQTNAE